jgi:hypothetical protein
MHRLVAVTLVLTALIGRLLSPTSLAFACMLDNQSSLSANGFVALKNFDLPTKNLANWAPFIFDRVYGQGQSIHFTENFNDLKKSLSTSVLQRPFLWKWGDGAQSIGHAASHIYAHTGWYIITVYAYDPSRSRANAWFPFDRAKIHIVPAGEVWRDNLGNDALLALDIVMTWGIRLALAVGAALLAYAFWHDWRKRKLHQV